MPFFARPDLSDEQFKQLSGSTLTLSGVTQIAKTDGFRLTDEFGTPVPVIATGTTNDFVLTYDSTTSNIRLKASASAGAFNYSGRTPTTCTVGGLSANTAVFGCSMVCILQDIIAPIVSPTIVEPFSTFDLLPATRIYEVGTSVSFTGYSTFDPGSISPVYCGGPSVRSCGLCYYQYSYVCCGTLTGATSPQTFQSFSISDNSLANTITEDVCYCGGDFPRKSDGTCLPALSAGTTTAISCTIFGIYPYYYGKVASGGAAAGANRPAVTKSLVTGGTKVVATSTGTLCINFNSTPDDYIWFATPDASTGKTCWFVNALNNGNIGGVISPGGNLFPANATITGITSTSPNWGSCLTYKVYISNYQTCSTSIMELRNS